MNGSGVAEGREVEQYQKSVRSVKQNRKLKIDSSIHEKLVYSRSSFANDWGNHYYSVNYSIQNTNHWAKMVTSQVSTFYYIEK